MSEVFQNSELERRCMGNSQLVHRVLCSFRLSFMHDLSELEINYLNGEVENVARIAHKIKGSAANAAAPRISETAKRIEELAKEGSSDLDELIGNLQSEFTEFAKAAFRKSHGFDNEETQGTDSGATPCV